MERAISFYEWLFEQKVTVKDGIYSMFDISGFRFGLFAYEKKGELHTYGNSCLPSIELDSVEKLNKILENCSIQFPLTKIGNNFVAEILDSEGNTLEVYCAIC